MEEKEKIKSKKKNKQKLTRTKKFKSFKISRGDRDLMEEKKDIKFYSCENITNFVPKILPKKSFCKPSLFVLNPDEKFLKKFTLNQIEHNLLVLDNSDSDSDDDDHNSSNLESLDEENKNQNQNEVEIKKDEEIINNNSKQKIESDINKNNEEIINNDSTNDESNSDKYLSIFDVISTNYK